MPLTIHEVLSERASAVAELFSVEPAPGSTLAEVKKVVAEATPRELQLWPNVLSFYDRYGPFILFAQLAGQRLNALAHKAADYAQRYEGVGSGGGHGHGVRHAVHHQRHGLPEGLPSRRWIRGGGDLLCVVGRFRPSPIRWRTANCR